MKKIIFLTILSLVGLTSFSQTKIKVTKLNTPYVYTEGISASGSATGVTFDLSFDQNVAFTIQAFADSVDITAGDTIDMDVTYKASLLNSAVTFSTYFTADSLGTGTPSLQNTTSSTSPWSNKYLNVDAVNNAADSVDLKIILNVVEIK